MKKIIGLILILTFVILGCREDKDGIVIPDSNKSYISSGSHWLDCDNEYWSGIKTEDCVPPATNCVVVCAPKKFSPTLDIYDSHVQNGTISEFYQSGGGQAFLPLRSDILTSLINGEVTIVKVTAGLPEIKYAVVPI